MSWAAACMRSEQRPVIVHKLETLEVIYDEQNGKIKQDI